MEQYKPTQEEVRAAEESMTGEQQAASERREDVRERIVNEPHKEVRVDDEGMQLVGEEKSYEKDRN